MSFKIGSNIGPYQLLEQLGHGGMATVFKAYHSGLDRDVAIKVLHPTLLEDTNFLARFQREARMIARLDHANIVPIFDYAEHDGNPYLVMKYVEGDTLKDRLSGIGVTDAEVIQIIEAVGAALSYAHDKNILHRDIKPSNVLLANDGHIYLADFGLARMVQSGETSLTADRLIGTPQYMSPEQAIGKPDIDARSDIYSLGVMLYEIMVGSVPFDADTPFAIIHDHIYTTPSDPFDRNPTVPKNVSRVLMKALSKLPADRYDSIQSMVSDFCVAMHTSDLPIGKSDVKTSAIENVDVTNPVEILPTDSNHGPIQAEVSSHFNLDRKEIRSKPVFGIQKGRLRNALIGISAALVLLLVIIFGRQIFDRDQNKEVITTPSLEASLLNQIPTPIETDNSLPTPDIETANMMLEAAIESWRNDHIDLAAAQIEKMQTAAQNDQGYYQIAFTRMREEEAWLPAAMTFFTMDNLLFTQYASSNEKFIHEVIYKAAKDKAAGDLFLENSENKYLVIASIRYDLYNKDPHLAKENIGSFLQNEARVKTFPESKLLEVEVNIELKNYFMVDLLLSKLLASPDLPEWITAEAENINDYMSQ